MIPAELVPFLLAAALLHHRQQRWVNRLSSRAYLDRYDFAHKLDTGLHRCTCAQCVGEFDHFFRWVQIR